MSLQPHDFISEHFMAKEFYCHDGTPITSDHLPLMKDLLEFLERARFAANILFPEHGETGIRIISGYRPTEYNKKCGGASNSGHLFINGAAADYVYTGKEIYGNRLWHIALGVDSSFPSRPYRLGNYEASKQSNAWVHVGCDYGVGGTRWFK